MEPFRFVHAARLLLDHQLHETGPVPDSIRQIVEDATLLAWDNVVESCLSERVDLLLLAGDSFDPADHSVRGPAALVRGLERLAERDIAVVISSGARDPWDAWPLGLRWPANTVRLDDDDEAPVVRDGKLLAVVRRDGDRTELVGAAPRLLKMSPGADRPLEIRLSGNNVRIPNRESNATHSEIPGAGEVPRADCYAAGGGAVRRTIVTEAQTTHDPGPCQAIRPFETGPHGCTLVDVDATGQWRRTFVPTAPVRFEQLGLTVLPEQTRDDLLLEMIAALERLPRCATDQVFLIAWNVRGRGPLLESLAEDEAQRALLDADHGLLGVQVHTHAVRLHPTARGSAIAGPADELTGEFDRRLSERTRQPQWALERCLFESRLHCGPWEAPLVSLLAELDAGEIAEAARRRGLQWLAVEEETPS